MASISNVTSTLSLKIAKVWPDGGASYTVDGLKGTIYFKHGHFQGVPPAVLSVTGLNLGVPVVAPPAKVVPVAASAPLNTEEFNPDVEAFVEA